MDGYTGHFLTPEKKDFFMSFNMVCVWNSEFGKVLFLSTKCPGLCANCQFNQIICVCPSVRVLNSLPTFYSIQLEVLQYPFIHLWPLSE
jgi:hypothetical protein